MTEFQKIIQKIFERDQEANKQALLYCNHCKINPNEEGVN
jgi:hypothetical protein